MTIIEFAREIGLSTATVSRAFGHRGRINEKTRQRVLARAAELGYRPNLHARNMARQRADSLAFFYDAPAGTDADYYVAEVSLGISAAAYAAGLYLYVHPIPPGSEPPSRVLDMIHSRGVDGFVVNLWRPWARPLVAAAEEAGVPYVVIDNTRAPARDVLSLAGPIEAASAEVGRYLHDQGRRAPAFVHGIHDRGKLAGFSHAWGPGTVVREDPGGTTFADGYAALGRLAAGGSPPDAVYAANDVLAMGVLRAAADLGLAVPGDLAVVGCDDQQMAAYCRPALTTVRLPKYEMGERAVQRLLALRDHQEPPTTDDLDCCLVQRESA